MFILSRIIDINFLEEYSLRKYIKKYFNMLLKTIKIHAEKITLKPTSIAAKTLIYRNYLRVKDKNEVFKILCKDDIFLIKYYGINDVADLNKLYQNV